MQRVIDSRDKWDYFDTDYWGSVQSEHIIALENFFGKHEKYYAIDGGKFPPKALVTGTRGRSSVRYYGRSEFDSYATGGDVFSE